MMIPHLPGWRVAAAFLGVYAAIWMALEGDLRLDLALSAWTLVVALWFLANRYLAGRALPLSRWLVLAALTGLAFGAGLVLLTLFFMALKTGLHAHGPEYTPAELTWVLGRLPVWSAIGALAGLGLGLMAVGLRRA